MPRQELPSSPRRVFTNTRSLIAKAYHSHRLRLLTSHTEVATNAGKQSFLDSTTVALIDEWTVLHPRNTKDRVGRFDVTLALALVNRSRDMLPLHFYSARMQSSIV